VAGRGVDYFVETRLSAMPAMPAHAGQAWQAGKDGYYNDTDGRL